ncbi:MAG: glyoxalase [Chloroflexi bacterium]|nr:glyoxalase [Chloroflexota bacterium]MCL5950892.1 glyoxalase [Chloroflexota bacterium]
MNQGIKTVIYPVKDIGKAKAMFSKILGVAPYVDSPYYVGFRIGDQEFGLDPNTHKHGMTAYYTVDDIKASLQVLVDAGAQVQEEIRDVGMGKLIASAKDADGNIIGLTQEPRAH